MVSGAVGCQGIWLRELPGSVLLCSLEKHMLPRLCTLTPKGPVVPVTRTRGRGCWKAMAVAMSQQLESTARIRCGIRYC